MNFYIRLFKKDVSKPAPRKNEHKKMMPNQTTVSKAIGCVGLFLLFPGTMASFIAYAVINGDTDYGSHDGPMPLYSNMFRFWPLAGNLTFGLGTVLLCTGLLMHRALQKNEESTNERCPLTLFAAMIFSTVCSLGVVASAEDFGYSAISTAHYIFTGGFMTGSFFVFSILARYNVPPEDKDRWIPKIAMPVLQVLLAFFAILAIASGCVMLSSTGETREMLQMLAASEFLLLFTYGVGYALLFPWLFPKDKYPPIPGPWKLHLPEL
jgi:phosphatidylglycerophosphate synthase